ASGSRGRAAPSAAPATTVLRLIVMTGLLFASASARAARLLGEIDVDVAPVLAQEDVAVVADDPRLREVGPDPVDVGLVGHVGDHDLLHPLHHLEPFRAIGQRALDLEKPVVLRQIEPRMVRLSLVRAVAEDEERLAVGAAAPGD